MHVLYTLFNRTTIGHVHVSTIHVGPHKSLATRDLRHNGSRVELRIEMFPRHAPTLGHRVAYMRVKSMQRSGTEAIRT